MFRQMIPQPRVSRGVVASVALALGAVAFTIHARKRSTAVRGTDQYWYVGDVDMKRSTGRPITNHVVPRATAPLGPATPDNPPTWIHNVPVTYLVCGVRRLLPDSYRAWTVTNTGLVLAGTAVVARVVRRRFGPVEAAVVAGTVLAFPLSTWFSINALSEAALVLLGASLAGSVEAMDAGAVAGGLLSATLISGGMYLQRDNHAPQLLMCGVSALALHSRSAVGRLTVLAVAATAVGTVVLRARVLPSMAGLSMGEMLMATIGDNTVIYGRLTWNSQEFLRKVPRGLAASVRPATAEEAVTKTLPVLTLGAAAAALTYQRRRPWLALAAAGSLGQYLLTGALIGVQPRYTASLYPLAAVAAANAWLPASGDADPCRLRSIRVVMGGSIALFAAASAVAGLRNANSADQERDEVARIREVARDLPAGAILSVNADIDGIEAVYAFVPRFVVSAHPLFHDAEWARHVIDLWGVVAVLDVAERSPSPLVDQLLGGEPARVGDVKVRGRAATIWLLDHPSRAGAK